MALITLAQAYEHLGLPMEDTPRVPAAPEYEPNVTMKMEQATAHVLKYMHVDADALAVLGWTVDASPATDPATDTDFAIVQAAILEVLANIFYDRGDREKPSDGPITPRVRNALSQLRAPVIS